ncbi:GNAT family N-acetyltransferase [Streptomyces boninensis]|uniref:GNAT family N-acetyltransferase n=1 Tax=Streptomyces boninensis TaxID=2039455 RepID=UPI003B2233B1
MRVPGRDERELLALEVDVNFRLVDEVWVEGAGDGAGRAVVWAWSPRGRVVALAPSACLRAEGVDLAGEAYVAGRAPQALGQLVDGAVEGGPCFVFPPPGGRRRLADLVAGAGLPLLASDAEGRRAARELIRPSNWQAEEWGRLISGGAGEWAMAVHGGKDVVCIAHTPVANDIAAETGIWTREDFRGRGLAPAVVAAWAAREGRRKEVLFYRTSAANRASQAVARTLGLRPLGWIWTVGAQ